MFEDISFPVYRKYKNSKHFFKVISKNSFEEIQIVGNQKTKTLINAEQFPELNHVYDLVYNSDIAIPITEVEYNSI